MLKSSQLIAFTATRQPDQAKTFYRDVLGLPLLGEDAFALVFEAHPTTLRVSIVKDFAPAPYTVLGWAVADIAAAVEYLAGRGVRFERFQGFAQDGLGIATFPDGTRVAWFKDPDGSILSLTQFKQGAGPAP